MLLDLQGWLPDLLELHLDKLNGLWPQWAVARSSPDYVWEELRRLEERIEANLDALVLAGDEAASLIEAGLDGDSYGVVLASALVTLRRGEGAAIESLFSLLSEAPAPKALAIAEAACFLEAHAPIDDALAEIAATGPPVAALGAGRALLLRGKVPPAPHRLVALLAAPDARVRAVAWRVTGELVARGLTPSPAPSDFHEALADASTADSALWAAAWSRQSWLLAHLRENAARTLGALEWLARLGGAADCALVMDAMGVVELGPSRFTAAAGLGQAALVEPLLQACAEPTPEVAYAAANAFWRITNQRVNMDTTTSIVGPDGDPDFAETVHRPDVPLLRQWWRGCRSEFTEGHRWARGLDADVVSEASLDCGAAMDRLVRDVFEGRQRPDLGRVERYPVAQAIGAR